MSKRRKQQSSGISQAIRKFFLSGFVVFTFIAYVIHQRFSHPDSPLVAITPTAVATASIPPTALPTSTSAAPAVANVAPTEPPVQPTQIPDTPTLVPPTATSSSNGKYKDGVYTGPTVNVYYGLVSVQATVQNGSITNVQFLQYPNDRRTSVRINTIAMPYLQQEAIQAQTANVNLISGATLTSEGFVVSLRAALQTAVN